LLTTITDAELLQRMLNPHIHLPENDLENKFYIEVLSIYQVHTNQCRTHIVENTRTQMALNTDGQYVTRVFNKNSL